jgi:mono/diheme cytochrome c family protein
MAVMRILIVSTVLGAVAATAQAQDIGDIRQGRQLAVDVCARCHAVGAGQARSPVAAAPGFEAIAKTPGMTVAVLNFWLTAQADRTMPLLVLTSQQVRDVSAYILSLRQ